MSTLWMLILLTAAPAWAGCEKDTDCKGDRICERGACVDPDGEVVARPESRRGPTSADLEDARDLRGDSGRRTGSSIVLGSIGTVAGIATVVTAAAGVSSPTPQAVGGGSLLFLSIAGPIAYDGAHRARRGLSLLDQEPLGPGLLIGGWSLYGSGVGAGVGMLIAGIITEDEAIGYAAIVPILLLVGGNALFHVDAGLNRVRLDRAIRKRRRRAMGPTLEVAATPWFGSESAGAAVYGSF